MGHQAIVSTRTQLASVTLIELMEVLTVADPITIA
jgi:hypothetical protein